MLNASSCDDLRFHPLDRHLNNNRAEQAGKILTWSYICIVYNSQNRNSTDTREMTNYRGALSILLLTAAQPTNGFQQSMHFTHRLNAMRRASSISTMYDDDSSNMNGNDITGISPMSSLSKTVRTVKVAYIKEFAEEEEYQEKKAKKKRVVLDVKDGTQTLTFEYGVEMPIVEVLMRDKKLGVSLREIKGRTLSEYCLELDSLRYVSPEEEVVRNQKLECSTGTEGSDGSIQVLDEKIVDAASGIVVSSVVRGGLAWNLGIRAGDFLVATSATIGDVSAKTTVIFSNLCSFHTYLTYTFWFLENVAEKHS